ncbi:hypothetical protein F2Q68_00040890 [Brassica cretica]|uniref:GDT1 family protein n=1 Tax=Brassica cretica TaxID=69181 RepID=A0A8S9MFS5_BRACR|nr:hypothetical protein F2Q68_00040890 [Brassica cretica]
MRQLSKHECFIFLSTISAQESGVDKEREGSDKELGRRGMTGTERIGLDAGDSLGALGLNLESTWPGVFDALFSSFSMILVTEIGDETFIIAALMAMRHPKATVLSCILMSRTLMKVFSGEKTSDVYGGDVLSETKPLQIQASAKKDIASAKVAK